MASEPLSPTFSTSSRSSKYPKRDTGFPEPFNGVSNTTLPHPEANLSPDAVISQEDINFTGFMRRSRRPFARHKGKRTISHGRITSTMEAMFSDSVIEEEEDGGDSAVEGNAAGRSRSGSSINPTRPGGVMSISTGRPSTSRDADSVFSHTMGDVSPTTSTSSIKKKKGGMFRKLRFLN